MVSDCASRRTMRAMASRVSIPADGGPSFFAGWSSGEVAVASLAVFLAFFIVASVTAKRWPFDVAFLALAAGGLAVTWFVMILMTGAAAVFAVVVGVAHRLIAPKHAAAVEAESNVLADQAIARLEQHEREG